MGLLEDKNTKKFLIGLIVLIIVIKTITIIVNEIFLYKGVKTDPALVGIKSFVVIGISLIMPLVYILALIISLKFIMKNKRNGYLLIGLLPLGFIFNSFDASFRYGIGIDMLAWLEIIIYLITSFLSFAYYFKFNKLTLTSETKPPTI